MGQHAHRISIPNNTDKEADMDNIILVVEFLGRIVLDAVELPKTNVVG